MVSRYVAALVLLRRSSSSSSQSEDNIQLQTRSAVAVASFVDFCVQRNLAQPPDKIVRNLCTFLCQDIDQTPTFAYTRKHTNGVLSFRKVQPETNGKDAPSPEEANRARLSRRGAGLAFIQLSTRFGSKLLDAVPKMWQSMAGGLLSACAGGMIFRVAAPSTPICNQLAPSDSTSKADNLMEKQYGQDVIDSLSVLDAVVPTFHEELWPKFHELFPMVGLALRSRFAIIRQCAARCFATMCDVMTMAAMRYAIEKVVPYLGDSLNLTNRQGATELVYREYHRRAVSLLIIHRLFSDIVQQLDIKALPYVIFMIVPVLGRMSDPDDDIRSTATNTFASLVKMVPLEVRHHHVLVHQIC